MSHNSSNPEKNKAMHEAMKKIFGEYPDGKLNKDDEGAIAMIVGHESGRVTIQFAKNLNWIGFTADEAIGLAETLVKHARQCGSTRALTFKIG